MTIAIEKPQPITLHRPAKPAVAAGPWSVQAIQDLLDLPFMELLHRAQTVHRAHFPELDIALREMRTVHGLCAFP
jgi:biotin synthase